jgi:cytochrome P450 family 4
LLFKHAVDLKAKVTWELDEIFGDSDRPCTQEDVSAMKYLDCCIKESLRIYPPAPFIIREITEPINIGLLNKFY